MSALGRAAVVAVMAIAAAACAGPASTWLLIAVESRGLGAAAATAESTDGHARLGVSESDARDVAAFLYQPR